MHRSFVVVGLGTFGLQTAKELYSGGADVLAIDQDPEVIQDIAAFVTKAVCADALEEETLKKIGAFDVDCAVIATRSRFDTTVLVTHMFKRAGVREILVQVDTEGKEGAIAAVGATAVIYPERDIARRIARNLLVPDLAEQIPLGKDVAILEVPVPPSFFGKTLIELDFRKKHRVTIIAVKKIPKSGKQDDIYEIPPQPDAPLNDHDTLVVLGNTTRLAEFREFAASQRRP